MTVMPDILVRMGEMAHAGRDYKEGPKTGRQTNSRWRKENGGIAWR